jgi:hypothetical protein
VRPRLPRLRDYLQDPAAQADWQLCAGERCGAAPFVFPTDGYLGFGYGDSWRPGHRHTGFDIFGPQPLGQTPVYAAYPGYLTRLPEWKSTVPRVEEHCPPSCRHILGPDWRHQLRLRHPGESRGPDPR